MGQEAEELQKRHKLQVNQSRMLKYCTLIGLKQSCDLEQPIRVLYFGATLEFVNDIHSCTFLLTLYEGLFNKEAVQWA